MSDQPKTGIGAGSFVPAEMADILQVQMRALLQEQADLLDETQRTMAAWTKRRQEAMEANFRTFQAMGGCKDPGAMIAAYSEWLTNGMNRIFADMNDARDDALRLAEIGQKSIPALFPRSAKAPPPKDSSTASRSEVRQTSGVPLAGSFEHVPEQKAAE